MQERRNPGEERDEKLRIALGKVVTPENLTTQLFRDISAGRNHSQRLHALWTVLGGVAAINMCNNNTVQDNGLFCLVLSINHRSTSD